MRTAFPFLLGLLSFIPLFAIGEGTGLPAAFAFATAYFFVCQLLLSRGDRDALRQDMRTMVALVAPPLLAVVIMCAVENLDVILSQGVSLVLTSVGGTVAGAFVASRLARRTPAPPPSPSPPSLPSPPSP